MKNTINTLRGVLNLKGYDALMAKKIAKYDVQIRKIMQDKMKTRCSITMFWADFNNIKTSPKIKSELIQQYARKAYELMSKKVYYLVNK